MKKYKVIFDNYAEEDLFEIYTFVALNDSIEHADKLFEAFKKTCYTLRSLPLRGRIPPELFEIGCGV